MSEKEKKKRTLKHLTGVDSQINLGWQKLVGHASLEHEENATDEETVLENLQFSLQLKHCVGEIGKLDKFKNVTEENVKGFFDQHPFRFIFFKNPPKEMVSTCVRWPVVAHGTTHGHEEKALPSYKLEIHPKQSYFERKSGVRLAFDADTESGLAEGMFITEDGTVIVMRPGPGDNIELVVPGNPGDMPLNYKC